jgi:branched-chain amino acid transport system ATP-binding protein
MAEPLLATARLIKHFGGVMATDSLSLEVMPGEIHAVIGPNGAGKTTLIAQLSGMMAPDAGSIRFDGADITRLKTPARARRGLARSFQITSILRDFTALDNVALAIQAHQGHSFRFWASARADAGLRDPAQAVLDEVGLGDRGHVLAGNLAHGEQRLLEIAIAMAGEPKMLLLDEPMAGMGAEESERMTRYLAGLKGRYTMLLVEHDMDAVFALADRITVLVYGRAIASGSAEQIRADPEVRSAYLGDEALGDGGAA